MGILVFLVSVIVFGLVGLVLWASSDLPMIQREIAMNTRKESEDGPTYKMVKILAVLYKVLAVIFWVLGLAAAFGGGGMMSSFL